MMLGVPAAHAKQAHDTRWPSKLRVSFPWPSAVADKVQFDGTGISHSRVPFGANSCSCSAVAALDVPSARSTSTDPGTRGAGTYAAAAAETVGDCDWLAVVVALAVTVEEGEGDWDGVQVLLPERD